MKHFDESAWLALLSVMPPRATGGREPVEPAASKIVQRFLRDVWRIFEERVVVYKSRGLVASVEPPSATLIAPESSVGLHVSRSGKAGAFHSLHCEREVGLNMCLVLDRNQLWQEHVSFALDREPESPWTFVEGHLARLEAKIEGGR